MKGEGCWLLMMLPSEWSVEKNVRSNTATLRHTSGLWTEVDASSLLRIGEAVDVEVTKQASGYRARLRPRPNSDSATTPEGCSDSLSMAIRDRDVPCPGRAQ